MSIWGHLRQGQTVLHTPVAPILQHSSIIDIHNDVPALSKCKILLQSLCSSVFNFYQKDFHLKYLNRFLGAQMGKLWLLGTFYFIKLSHSLRIAEKLDISICSSTYFPW